MPPRIEDVNAALTQLTTWGNLESHPDTARVSSLEALHAQRQTRHDDARETAEATANRREQADADVEREGQTLVQSWQNCFAGFEQLWIGPDDEFAALAALAEWVVALDGDNPARQRLQVAQQQASVRLAARRVALQVQQQALQRLTESGMTRSQLAADALGDPHGLDGGRPAATLVQRSGVS